MLQENDNTQQQVEKVFGVEFTSEGRLKKEMIHGWENKPQFCVSFIALLSQKQELLNTARLWVCKSVLVQILTYDH